MTTINYETSRLSDIPRDWPGGRHPRLETWLFQSTTNWISIQHLYDRVRDGKLPGRLLRLQSISVQWRLCNHVTSPIYSSDPELQFDLSDSSTLCYLIPKIAAINSHWWHILWFRYSFFAIFSSHSLMHPACPFFEWHQIVLQQAAPTSILQSLSCFKPSDVLCHSLHRNHDRGNNRSERKSDLSLIHESLFDYVCGVSSKWIRAEECSLLLSLSSSFSWTLVSIDLLSALVTNRSNFLLHHTMQSGFHEMLRMFMECDVLPGF